MSMLYLVLALLFSVFVAAVAMTNSVIVTVYYLFGHAQISLIVLILGSAIAGALAMGFFGLFRSIRTHLKFREAHRKQLELQSRVDVLEKEKVKLEYDINRQQQEREAAVAKEHTVVKQSSSQAGDNRELSRA